ncbi:MAG: polysaccharide lyase beta-sandwich domain-containing protein [Candidatus Symbiothrix sp.]|jgi:chondroitin AC lyase|nr:polysaccharide lyase beta-sandwich domain-containing protein [Candidatus Symbiothrix sp.]
MRKLLLIALWVGFCLPCIANDIQTIRRNYKQAILTEDADVAEVLTLLTALPKEATVSDNVIVELMQQYPLDDAFITSLLERVQPDGSWSDVDYTSQLRSGWPPSDHVRRTVELTKAFSSTKSAFYQSERVKETIHRLLAFWFKSKLRSDNWWHNEIGVPKLMGSILVLFEENLTPWELEEGIQVLNHAQIKMTGQNKVWLSANVLIRALLQNDLELVKTARNSIASEIRNDQLEGIKADHSFHQHGAQLQFGNYGMSFVTSMSLWAQVFAGSSLGFNQEQLDILSDLINEGYGRILWKGYMDTNSLGRQYFHNVQRHKAFAVILSAINLAKIDSKNQDKYNALITGNLLVNGATNKLGFYHFWQSDLTVQRTSQWMTSIRMASRRVIGAEALNGDNLKGYYVADGAMMLYQTGDEYDNIFPCWDWRKIPGITNYETTQPLPSLVGKSYKNESNFVGSAGDGKTGLTAMELNRDGLKAHKAWLFTGKFILCLGAGITTDSTCVVTTSVEQRLQRGSLLQLKHKKNDIRLFHDRTGYIIVDGKDVKTQTAQRTGKWNEIMNIYPDDMTETNEIVSIWIDHGVKPQKASYAYFVLPATDEKAVKSFDPTSVKILQNTPDLQLVYLPANHTHYIASYNPLQMDLYKDVHIESDFGGLFLIKRIGKELELTFSDPTQTQTSINIWVNKKKYTVAGIIPIKIPSPSMI